MNPSVDSLIDGKKTLVITLTGDFLAGNAPENKDKALKELKPSLADCVLKADKLGSWDSSAIVFVSDVYRFCLDHKIKCDFSGLPSGMQRLLKLSYAVPARGEGAAHGVNRKLPFFERMGDRALRISNAFLSGVSFCQEAFGAVLRFIRGKAVMRRVDFLFALQDCGISALPVVGLINFMVGLIFAFVGSILLGIFAAQVYVSTLVAIVMVRVMSAVMTGVIMAGRTGSSYAAIIGSMQANEEVDALNTMGIPPMDFLVLPRILALMLMMPLLTIYANVLGILGGAFVGIFVLDIPPELYIEMTRNALSFKIFMVGLTHGTVFGIIIALCGCYYGIRSGRNADGVGRSTTMAVVTSIIWIVVATAILTIFFQRLHI